MTEDFAETITDNGEETAECGHCGTPTPIEALHHHGEDYDLCRPCSDRFVADVIACHHEFSPVERDPDWGELGRHCTRCGVWWDQDWAMSWFPMACDGFVDLVGDGGVMRGLAALALLLAAGTGHAETTPGFELNHTRSPAGRRNRAAGCAGPAPTPMVSAMW